MGYNLHITKASEWWQSESSPISEQEWTSLVAHDDELKMDTTLTAVNPKTREVIEVSNPLMACWTNPRSREEHYFYYSRGRVTIKNPSETVIEKMKAIAAKLGARVQGDEGESY